MPQRVQKVLLRVFFSHFVDKMGSDQDTISVFLIKLYEVEAI